MLFGVGTRTDKRQTKCSLSTHSGLRFSMNERLLLGTLTMLKRPRWALFGRRLQPHLDLNNRFGCHRAVSYIATMGAKLPIVRRSLPI